MLERIFKLKENNTTQKSEIIGGMTTFMTMAYILVVIPSILSSTGMNADALFTSTAISAIIGCFLMGFMANLPISLAPGMGITAFFTYTIVLQMGYSWQTALAAIFVEGIIFILLSIFNIRELIIRSIPLALKQAIAVGIGLFVTTIGLINSGVIVKGEPLSTFGNISSPSVMLTFISIVIIGALLIRKVHGALLLGLFISTIIGIFMGVVEFSSDFTPFSMPNSIEPIAFKMDFSQIFTLDMMVVIFTLVFSDLFDTAGTLFAVCSKSNLIDEKGNIKGAKNAFLADAIATTVGSLFGASTVTSYVESTSGVVAGGRTGMTAIVTGLMFFLSLFLAPIFSLIPTAATSAVLVVVGLFMISSVVSIDFDNYKDSLPAFITIIIIPLSYNISDGIVYGFISYVIIRMLIGKFKEVSAVMYGLFILFLLKIFLI